MWTVFSQTARFGIYRTVTKIRSTPNSWIFALKIGSRTKSTTLNLVITFIFTYNLVFERYRPVAQSSLSFFILSFSGTFYGWILSAEYFQDFILFVQPPDPIRTRQATCEGLFSVLSVSFSRSRSKWSKKSLRHDKHKFLAKNNFSFWIWNLREWNDENFPGWYASRARFVTTIF